MTATTKQFRSVGEPLVVPSDVVEGARRLAQLLAPRVQRTYGEATLYQESEPEWNQHGDRVSLEFRFRNGADILVMFMLLHGRLYFDGALGRTSRGEDEWSATFLSKPPTEDNPRPERLDFFERQVAHANSVGLRPITLRAFRRREPAPKLINFTGFRELRLLYYQVQRWDRRIRCIAHRAGDTKNAKLWLLAARLRGRFGDIRNWADCAMASGDRNEMRAAYNAALAQRGAEWIAVDLARAIEDLALLESLFTHLEAGYGAAGDWFDCHAAIAALRRKQARAAVPRRIEAPNDDLRGDVDGIAVLCMIAVVIGLVIRLWEPLLAYLGLT